MRWPINWLLVHNSLRRLDILQKSRLVCPAHHGLDRWPWIGDPSVFHHQSLVNASCRFSQRGYVWWQYVAWSWSSSDGMVWCWDRAMNQLNSPLGQDPPRYKRRTMGREIWNLFPSLSSTFKDRLLAYIHQSRNFLFEFHVKRAQHYTLKSLQTSCLCLTPLPSILWFYNHTSCHPHKPVGPLPLFLLLFRVRMDIIPFHMQAYTVVCQCRRQKRLKVLRPAAHRTTRQQLRVAMLQAQAITIPHRMGLQQALTY